MKLVILDREGTIGRLRDDFVRTPEEWQPLPGALEAIARLNHAGFHAVVVCNQSGLGRGLFDAVALNAIHAKMHQLLSAAGGRIDAVFFCPHAPDAGCACRKPGTGLFAQVAERYGMDLATVPAVGDSLHDLEAAVAAGAEPHLVLTGRLGATHPVLRKRAGGPVEPGDGMPAGTRVHADLDAFAEHLLARDAVPLPQVAY
jgi:D-glycero-D-manno-heptose 1,7-bisphosphate phosphatase